MCVVITNMKRTKQQNFQIACEGRPDFKSKSWNKKIKSKNTMCVWCECKRILFQKYDNNTTRSWQRFVPTTSVEHTEGNVRFYFYFYPLGT